MVSASFWTKEAVDILKTRHAELASGGEIARELGTTRSAVISKAKRLGLVRAEVKAERLPAPPPVPMGPIPFLSRNMEKQCAAILDLPPDARGMPFVCGRAVVPNHAWCPEHFTRYIDLVRMENGKTRHAYKYL